jgi:hypothetical protein
MQGKFLKLYNQEMTFYATLQKEENTQVPKTIKNLINP